jgi:feruloyl esterase
VGAAILIAAVAITPLSVVSADAAECGDLATLALPQTKIDAAQSIPAGSYTPPYTKPLADLPAFCRVHGVVSPVPGSVIGFEVWLPQTNWNRKLEMFGNGGYSSDMSYPDMAARLKAAYVSVATDTGHIGSDPSFAIARPESIPDWGYRAVHETVERAKLLIRAFYGEPPSSQLF